MISGEEHGKPRFFISHGTHDHILPINRCRRRIADELKMRGFDVTFWEFDGDHEIPADVAREGLLSISKTLATRITTKALPSLVTYLPYCGDL